MAVHSATADRFLDEIFTSAVDRTAETKAATEAAMKAKVLDAVVGDVEASLNPSEVVVKDLVSGFLLPEVDRRRAVGSDDVAERRYLDAAHSVVVHAVKDVQSVLIAQGSK